MLTWVGVSATAGVDIWPIETWAQQRAVARGEAVPSEHDTDGGPADGMDRVPGAAPSDVELVRHMIADKAALERIARDVVAALKLEP